MNTKKICLIAILTALYCVLASLMKFVIVGNTMIDLGYVVLAVACVAVGPWAGFVGAVGCGLESILFSQYGFSIGWFVANLIIGVVCGLIYTKYEGLWIRLVTLFVICAVALFGAKGFIECALYGIPVSVKMIRIIPQFITDYIAMVLGTLLVFKIPNLNEARY